MSVSSSISSNVTWSSKTSFLMATIGIAVGLGNIWRFPYVVGTNGGGAFVLVYILTLLCFAAPIMVAELILGRQGKKDPLGSMKVLVKENGANKAWHTIGWLSLLIPFIALSYYSVVAGWTVDYTVQSLMGTFNNIDSEGSKSYFQSLAGSASKSIFCYLPLSPLVPLLFRVD